ncbi:MAG: cytochrome P450 [Pseudomonadales bacterium]|jgi:cytochrome P450|nr:cytochrome P450 [Pseudomonadales bacterium]
MSSHDDGAGLPSGRALTAHDDAFRDDPQPIYDTLRARAPRHRDAAYGRILLTRYDDVRHVVRDAGFGVDARRTHGDSYMRRVAGTGVAQSEGETAYEPPLVLLDDPGHRRIRKLVARAFDPKAVAAMAPRIEAIAAALIDAIGDRRAIDFVTDFAGPLPTQAILVMMGMEDAPVADFKRWSEDVLFGYDPHRGPEVQDRLRRAFVAMGGHFRAAVAARREQPGDDLISAMVRAQEDGDALTDLEIVSLCTQLMVAGNVTTTDLMGNGLHALLTHPRQLARLRSEPALMENAVEEMLRFDCPITETARIPFADTHVGDCPVRSGDTLTTSLAAANHDPAMFADPHAFDLARDAKAHLGFGSGIHVCLGAALARLETRIGLGAFLEAFPGIGLDPQRPPERRRLPFFRGFATLPLRVDRSRQP